jgi:hypothetical protein
MSNTPTLESADPRESTGIGRPSAEKSSSRLTQTPDVPPDPQRQQAQQAQQQEQPAPAVTFPEGGTVAWLTVAGA